MDSNALEMIRGESKVWDFALTRTDEASGNTVPLDLTGALDLTFTAKASTSDVTPLIQKTLGAGVNVTDEANGQFTVTLNSSDTASFPTSIALVYDIHVEEADLQQSTPILSTLLVKADVYH